MERPEDSGTPPRGADTVGDTDGPLPEETPEHEGSSLEELPDAVGDGDDKSDRGKGRGGGAGRAALLGAVIVLAVVAGIVAGALVRGGDDGAGAASTTTTETTTEPDEPGLPASVVPATSAAGAPVDRPDLPPSSRVAEANEPVRVGDFVVTFGRTDPDAAEDVAAGDGTYADELGEGDVLITATVRVRNVADRPLDPAVDLLAGYLGGDGREYDMLRGQFCMAEDSLYDVGNLPPGGEVTGTVCQGLPREAVEGGVWVMRAADDYGAVAHFAASH